MTDETCKQIKCGVQNCHFNANSMCHADVVEVNAMGRGEVETSQSTCCTTFSSD